MNASDNRQTDNPNQGADNREMHYARGKTLGGSSARNFLVYHRYDVNHTAVVSIDQKQTDSRLRADVGRPSG